MVELGLIQTNNQTTTIHPFQKFWILKKYVKTIRWLKKKKKNLTGNSGEVIGEVIDKIVEVVDESEEAGGFSVAFAVDAVDLVASFNQSSCAAYSKPIDSIQFN